VTAQKTSALALADSTVPTPKYCFKKQNIFNDEISRISLGYRRAGLIIAYKNSNTCLVHIGNMTQANCNKTEMKNIYKFNMNQSLALMPNSNGKSSQSQPNCTLLLA